MKLSDIDASNMENAKAGFAKYLIHHEYEEDFEIQMMTPFRDNLIIIGCSAYEHWSSCVEETLNLKDIKDAAYDAGPGFVYVYEIEDASKGAMAYVQLYEESEGYRHILLLIV